MPEGIAKSSKPVVAQTIVAPTTTQPVMNIDGAPLDVLRHFDIDYTTADSKEIGKARQVYELLSPGKTIGDLLISIKEIEGKIGLSGYENRLNRVWNYIQINKQIEDLQKRQEAMKYV